MGPLHPGRPQAYHTTGRPRASSHRMPTTPQGDRKGQYRSNKKNVSKGAVFEMKTLIGGAFVAEMGGVLEDARIEAQAAWRKQRGRVAQVGQDVLPEARLGVGRHQRGQQERIAEHVNGMGEAEAVRVQVSLSR